MCFSILFVGGKINEYITLKKFNTLHYKFNNLLTGYYLVGKTNLESGLYSF